MVAVYPAGLAPVWSAGGRGDDGRRWTRAGPRQRFAGNETGRAKRAPGTGAGPHNTGAGSRQAVSPARLSALAIHCRTATCRPTRPRLGAPRGSASAVTGPPGSAVPSWAGRAQRGYPGHRARTPATPRRCLSGPLRLRVRRGCGLSAQVRTHALRQRQQRRNRWWRRETLPGEGLRDRPRGAGNAPQPNDIMTGSPPAWRLISSSGSPRRAGCARGCRRSR